ncbi:MAG TPA: sulfatase, partial [Vicinamibacteria bacterium]
MLASLLLLAATSAPNVVLVTIDTLRADRVGAYGHAGGETPTIDRLALEGVLALDAVVQVPQTRPSHASIFTGRYPYEHGIRDNYSRPLPPGTPTMAAILRQRGWDTGAFIGAYPVSRPSGLDQGFAAYDDPFAAGDDTTRQARTERRAKEVVDRALEWLEKPRPGPFFAWVHLFDPHAPYEAPEPFRKRHAASPYDGEVAYADAQLSRIVGWLDARGLRGRTLLVVTSDHGEGLGDHGEEEHMLFVYDSTLRVPLVFSWPGRLPAGARVRGQFRSVDLLATILDLASVPAPPTSGTSRKAALREGGRIPANESYAESLYAQLHFGFAPLRALRGDGWKLIDVPRPELYRISEDPGEMRNLVDERASVATAMRANLRLLDRGRDSAPDLPPVDEAAAERLAALGYVGGGGASGG